MSPAAGVREHRLSQRAQTERGRAGAAGKICECRHKKDGHDETRAADRVYRNARLSSFDILVVLECISDCASSGLENTARLFCFRVCYK